MVLNIFKTVILSWAICAWPSFAYAQGNEPTTFTSPLAKENIGVKKRPDVYIGGRRVISKSHASGKLSMHQLTDLPPSLDKPNIRASIEQRRHMKVYNHNPSEGSLDAPVTVIEMTDLSCLQCYEQMRQVDEILKEFKDNIRFVHIHLPIDYYNTSNPAAFYGRLAHQSGVFWKYRYLLSQLEEINENVYSETLLKAGVDVRRLRRLIRKNARQFYRELDADILLSKNMNEQRPPAYYVNGIRIGTTISFDQMRDLIAYEIEQRKAIP